MERSKPAFRLQMKLIAGTSPSACEAVLKSARDRGASAVRRLFPDSADDDLATLWILDADSAAAAQRLLRELPKLPSVEFVEPEVRRKRMKA